METPKPKTTKEATSAPAGKTASMPPAVPRVAPLFRKIDWFALIFTFGVVWAVYVFTLAPELTLEDSGELCTGAFYAGIPHPPGYPFWSIYAWLWTHVPIGNVAWRVELGESAAAAMACGLVAFMVSRGSSMLMEGIDELKGIAAKWENAICGVSGIVAGVMLGFGAVMWSESVAINRISLFGVPWVMTVLLCIFRWLYAPHQRRYLYAAMFFFGLCATIHQTLLVAAMGLEVAISLSRPRLGRYFVLGNSVVFLMGLILRAEFPLPPTVDKASMMIIFCGVGIVSIAAYFTLAALTEETFDEFCLDGAGAAFFLLLAATPVGGAICVVLALAALGCAVYLMIKTWRLGHEWVPVIICTILGICGAAFYLYEPLAGMSNPPMQWGYPRTWDGFLHALGRGQYEQPNPTNIFTEPDRFITQLGMLVSDITTEFNWVMIFLALVPLFFLLKMKRRERSWIIGLTGVYLCIGILLVILMNPSPDRQNADLHKVFFTSSHGVVAIMAGYGLALTVAYMATHYKTFRTIGLMLAVVALFPAFIALSNGVNNTFYGGTHSLEYKNILLLFFALGAAFVLAGLAAQWRLRTATAAGGAPSDERMFIWAYGAVACICLAMAAFLVFFDAKSLTAGEITTALSHLFSPNQYSLPMLAGVLVLGVAILFIGGLTLYRDRAPLLITLGLFAVMPIASGLSHWGSSEQRNHWFGYWFGHDMFTPPFIGADGKMSYDLKAREEAMKGPDSKLVYPEMTRDAILFGGTDPGRFCPTYMIFCESFTPHDQQPVQDQKFDRRDVYIITQNALADPTYLDYIRAHYNRSKQIDPPFFQEAFRHIFGGANEIKQNYKTNFLARLAYHYLDKPFTELGAKIEARRRKEGVYPPKEIYIPTAEDSSRCFGDYMNDVQQRFDHDQRFPREPRQIKPGEEPHVEGDRISVSGQVSVMSINGLITKVIFDHNPTNEFFVEESFPLDWMYPYLSPFGVIMKINRQPIDEMSDETVKRDHEFWCRYSDRMIGNWINYDTTVKEITDFIEKVYLRHDFTGFNGNRRFIRDEQAQKSFSKLRSAIGGVYEWRSRHAKNQAEQQRMLKEAEFAFRQSFAYCPSSPEAVYHYVTLLYGIGRLDDAERVASTWLRLDPFNRAVQELVRNLQSMKNSGQGKPQTTEVQAPLDQLEKDFHDNSNNFQAGLLLAAGLVQIQSNNLALPVLDKILANPKVDLNTIMLAAQGYAQMSNYSKLEGALNQAVVAYPHSPEAWYNLAGVEAFIGKKPEAIKALSQALDESGKRLTKDPKASNLRIEARTDERFAALRQSPEFQQLTK